MFFTYAIYNEEKDKIYIGQTINISDRIKRHNKIYPSKKTSYTSKNSGKWILVHKEEFESRAEAIKREKELKSYRGRIFIRDLIEKKRVVSSVGRAVAF